MQMKWTRLLPSWDSKSHAELCRQKCASGSWGNAPSGSAGQIEAQESAFFTGSRMVSRVTPGPFSGNCTSHSWVW